ncbi:Transaldolase [Glycine max]|nr:Transaldolase [Glycine max]
MMQSYDHIIVKQEQCVESNLSERKTVLEVCETIVKRGGSLAGAGIVGIVQKMEEDQRGLVFGNGKRSVVAIDGGIYENYPQYRAYLQDSVIELLGTEKSNNVVIEHTKDGSGIGAAVLAASNSMELVEAGKDIESAYWELVVKDIQDTCKLLELIYNETDGEDGHVSLAVSPKLANDTKGTIEAAKWLHNMVGSPCVYMKIPATDESISSMKEVISLGISVNATLIFCLPKYEAVIDAYLDGLESCGMTDLSKVSSAAAFYISRVDVTLDKKLEQIGTTEALDLKGKGAVAQAVLAYQLYQKKFSGPRWERLENRGAKKQRLMWASTNVKNPSYPDTFYVNSLIGPDTISTLPVQVLQAFMDHGILSRTLDAKVSEAQDIYNAIEKLGIDWSSVGSELEHEVLDSFTKSFDNVLECMQKKAMNIYSFQKHV